MLGAEPIMAELRASFHATDARSDILATRLDSMGERIDRQQTHLEGAEEHISGLEDGTAKIVKRLEKLETRLKTVAIKNEDLEVRAATITCVFLKAIPPKCRCKDTT
ncbi:hypothetical protein NDU88_007386 [Pleurodeles waltl]|uniref:Uncharacterized protein n=1 Tax=Pleurodeles waltl TaxID=8319 RepID=A0AAV7PLP7_PLEWA|nr:hypothetical protein NDU88_007386 [Pleurodeles waltl]